MQKTRRSFLATLVSLLPASLLGRRRADPEPSYLSAEEAQAYFDRCLADAEARKSAPRWAVGRHFYDDLDDPMRSLRPKRPWTTVWHVWSGTKLEIVERIRREAAALEESEYPLAPVPFSAWCAATWPGSVEPEPSIRPGYDLDADEQFQWWPRSTWSFYPIDTQGRCGGPDVSDLQSLLAGYRQQSERIVDNVGIRQR